MVWYFYFFPTLNKKRVATVLQNSGFISSHRVLRIKNTTYLSILVETASFCPGFANFAFLLFRSIKL
ncbi:MAG: hypothetical protein DA408_09300 [Bacteroidetes bacterium]|nr:MAG: hypothetical protein C7N36_09270 [Bacteroidota bacterium]PTM12793.1 MAG: hypothetical protein DA408_09300 [Bacteroidota bacterium]